MSFQGEIDSLVSTVDALMQRRYAPGPSYRAMELLLGRIPSLDDVGDFTTTQNASSSEGCN